MNRYDVISELTELKLPPGQYVVVGGAGLALRDIRETEDIDLVVSEQLFENLSRTGWQAKNRPNGKPGLHHGRIEAYLDVNCGSFEPSTISLLAQAQMVHDIPVISLETLAKFKTEYGRDKDKQDLELIKTYLESERENEEQ